MPDEDDDGGRLGHGSNHAAHTDDTQEGEEGLLAAWAGTLPWERNGVFAAARDARAASQVLKGDVRELSEFMLPEGIYRETATGSESVSVFILPASPHPQQQRQQQLRQ